MKKFFIFAALLLTISASAQGNNGQGSEHGNGGNGNHYGWDDPEEPQDPEAPIPAWMIVGLGVTATLIARKYLK